MRYLHAHAASSHDRRYAYAVGRIRALEMQLLGTQRLERMAEARDLDEALRLLSDTTYSVHFDEMEDIGYDACLTNEEDRLLALVDALSLDRDVSDILRLRYDYHNLKVALRERTSERDLAGLYVAFGRFEPEMIRAAAKAESIDLLPEVLIGAAMDALDAYSRSQDPAEIDVAIDMAMFARFLSLAAGYGGLYIEAIVRTWIDLANIRTFMRSRYLGIESRTLPGTLFPGGFARLADFYETLPLPLDEVLQRFEFSPYRGVIEVGGAGLEREDSFVDLEREIDNYMIEFLRLSRYFTFGLEVLIAYALLKQNEIRALRLILAAKDKGLPVEAIKERIPYAE